MKQPAAPTWVEFVLACGWRANAHYLAHVVGVARADVETVRRTRACATLPEPMGFAELFARWHGRPPVDDDWPVPTRSGHGHYDWQTPEIALLATLVGRLGVVEIANVLTARLRQRTGDAEAVRTRGAVQSRIAVIGMQTRDVLGGITVTEAARELGTSAQIYNAIDNGTLQTRRVGKLLVIPHEAWTAWKAKRVAAPEGFIRLSTLKQPLGIRSDKLSEWARAGYVPTAVRCNPFGTKGPSTQFGTWYVDKAVGDQLISDRRAGKPMPWHGKPMPDNLGVTYRLWCQRRHPVSCATCATIWGPEGVPATQEDYAARYPALAHGAKRHLTMLWAPGLSVAELAAEARTKVQWVRRAIANGALAAAEVDGTVRITRTEATRWIDRKCPSGDSQKSWISLENACNSYLFTMRELKALIAEKRLQSKLGREGAQRGVEYVPKHQCALLREAIGFTEEEAARRVGVTVERLRVLLEGLTWREAKGIPLATVQAAIKRLESQEGYSLEEAAELLGMPLAWVKARKCDGTIRVSQARWDRRRQYISEPMMARLRKALSQPAAPVAKPLGDDWLLLGEAAHEAGVCTTTITRWARDGELRCRTESRNARYHREAVRARAREYWASARFLRAVRPKWLVEELATENRASHESGACEDAPLSRTRDAVASLQQGAMNDARAAHTRSAERTGQRACRA